MASWPEVLQQGWVGSCTAVADGGRSVTLGGSVTKEAEDQTNQVHVCRRPPSPCGLEASARERKGLRRAPERLAQAHPLKPLLAGAAGSCAPRSGAWPNTPPVACWTSGWAERPWGRALRAAQSSATSAWSTRRSRTTSPPADLDPGSAACAASSTFRRRGRLPFRDRCCDTVLAVEVLEHVRDPQRCLAEFARVLAPGGRLLVTVPFIAPRHQTALRLRPLHP